MKARLSRHMLYNRIISSLRAFGRIDPWRYAAMTAIVVGAGLLIYVISQYWAMYSEQKRLVTQWQHQQLRLSADGQVTDDGLTRLTIPKINFNAVVVEGTSHRALLLGPGHLKETPAPGDLGNSVISGHRDTFFRHLYELKKGDVITVQRSGQSFDYEVTGKRIVQPTDLSVLDPTPDARLTLITCYPIYYIGPAPERLIVFAKRSSQHEARVEVTSSTAAKSADVSAR